jgi:hypothetical protein
LTDATALHDPAHGAGPDPSFPEAVTARGREFVWELYLRMAERFTRSPPGRGETKALDRSPFRSRVRPHAWALRRGLTRRRHGMGGISLGGVLVIVGIVVAIFWSVWVGLIVALIGLVVFGGFARGRWY